MKWRRQRNQRQSILLEQPAAKLAEIGTQLRLKREEKGLSLEQVAVRTLIQRRLLQAIELGQLDELPESIYIRSFIKQYADFLGLDGTELSNTFPASDRRLSTKPTWIRLPAAQFRPIHLYLLYIVMVVGTVNTLSQMLSRSSLQIDRDQIQEQPLFTSTSKQKSDKIEPVSTKPSTASKINQPVQVNVTVTAESWIRIVADGKKQFEGHLPQGTQRTWVAKEQLTVKVGNAGGVMVTFNQEKARQLGNFGEVQEVTFAANPRS